MRVAVEIDYSGTGARGGTYYLNHLVANLPAAMPQDEFLLFGFFYTDYEKKVGQFPLPPSPRVKRCVRRWPQSLVEKIEWGWKMPLIESYLGFKGVDVYHAWRPPSRGFERVIQTVPDICPVTHPHWTTPAAIELWKQRLLPGIMKAKRVLTYSLATRDYLVQRLGLDERRIGITHLGADPATFKPLTGDPRLEELRARRGLPKKFLLMVGPFDVVTNFAAVVDALTAWKKSGAELPEFVAVGPVDDYVRGLQGRLAEAGLAERFHWTGYVPHAELVLLYNMATALVYPSLLPGIELPPYEAMASGAPVITSLIETIGDAGLLIDAESPAEIGAAMRRVWESDAVRADLSARGLARAAQFTWERTARETAVLYQEVAGGR
jgi:glycosyltransferase involved in cell wall biosynthesis